MIPLRQIMRSYNRMLPNIRLMSSQPLVDVNVDNQGVAVVTMQRLPVNSLNLELIQELNKALDEVSKNKSKGMVLTTASPSVFSAGLDIMEMYKPDPKRAEAFWSSLQDLWINLFGSKFPTAAAISGHAPAGGCLLSMSCEYRVMLSGKYAIGLNETALGIVAPPWFMDTMCHTIPVRQAEIALTTAKMFSVDEALKVGLIDEVGADKNEVMEKCKKFISKFDKVPPLARAMTKQLIRQGPITRLQKSRQQDLKLFLDVIMNPKVQQSLEFYIQSLKQKTAK